MIRTEAARVHCSECGTELIPGKKFCHACGTRVVATCPSCGATVQPTFRFCPDCGTSLGQAAPEAPVHAEESAPRAATAGPVSARMPDELAQKIMANRAAMTGERKVVTVLFCDLVGSTAIAERLDPEEYRDLLAQYLDAVFGPVYRFEGIVNQLAGDGVMALFGAPIAHEDAPQRAVRAALAIREALEQLNERLGAQRGVRLEARFGIHTGPVVVGTVGSDLKMDYTAIGDTTNLAARLQSLAGPGQVLVSDTTQRRIRGYFELEAAGLFDVKGKSEPVRAFRVLAACTETSAFAVAAARGLTPFVGRQAELAQLHACYERLTEGLAQVVTVVGEAGSGKSRLLYEFHEQTVGDSTIRLEARCSSLTQAVPYAPWMSLLRHYFEVRPSDAPEVAVARIAEKLDAIGMEADAVCPYLCRILSIPTDTAGEPEWDELKRQTFQAMARLVMALSHIAPVTVTIEDLHWMDEASREMLDLAMASLRGRIMFLLTHRPDTVPAWRTSAAMTQLRLRPLADDDVTQIVRAIAGGALPGELETAVRTKAEGNPFFAEEIARAIVEEGAVGHDDGRVTMLRPFDEMRLPGTVEEVIAARVDRFGPDAKRVSQVAAVLGRQFRRTHLLGLLTGEGVDVAAGLEELASRGVVHRKTVLSDDEYRFGESVTQEVLYEGLLHRERRQLHERIAEVLEAEGVENDPEKPALIAQHYARGDNPGRAVDWLLRAAHQAEALPSYAAAQRFYRQAWDASQSRAARERGGAASLQPGAVLAAIGVGRMAVIYNSPDGDSERIAARGEEIATQLGDTESVAALGTYRGLIVMGGARERFAEGLAMVEAGFRRAQTAGLAVAARNISRGLAWAYLYDGQLDRSLAIFEAAVREMEGTNDERRLSDIYLGSRFMRDGARWQAEDFAGAIAGATETYELACRAGNRTVRGGASSVLAVAYLAHGAWEAAKSWAERCLEVAEPIRNIASLRTSGIVLVEARTALGESFNAARYLEYIEQEHAAPGDMASKCLWSVQALLRLGETQRARRFVETAYAHAGGRLRELLCDVALADVVFHQGSEYWDDAARRFAETTERAAQLGVRSVLATTLLGGAEVAAALGNFAAASRLARQAADAAASVGFQRYDAILSPFLAAGDGAPTARAAVG